MITAKLPLSDSDASEIEAEIVAGNLARLPLLARDTLDHKQTNFDILNHRKEFFRKFGQGKLECLQYFGVLCAMTDDQFGWSVFIKVIDEDLDAKLPFVAYRYMRLVQTDEEVRKNWFFLINLSANKGHLHSRRIAFDRSVAGLGLFGRAASFVHRMYIAICAIPIILRNRSDTRLP